MPDIFHNTLGPLAWGIAAAVPAAIIALYFLKLKRQPVETPSTYLWTKVFEDLHVNSIWQRFRRNLLLALQLLIVGLALLALLRPGWRDQSLSGQRFIFLIDRSASMATADVDGNTRLEAAKQAAIKLIDQLSGDMSAMVVAFDDEADVVQQYTDSRRQLREAIASISQTAKQTDVHSALELARGFASPVQTSPSGNERESAADKNSADQVVLYILSDGRFSSDDTVSLDEVKTHYLPFGSADADNLAITSLTVADNPADFDARQAFVQISNFTRDDQKVVVELLSDGQLIDAAELAAPAGDAVGATFELGDATTGELEARITPTAGANDSLASDNVAYALLDRSRTGRTLLVTTGNHALELALATDAVRRIVNVDKLNPDDLDLPDVAKRLESGVYDLVIFDRCRPTKADDMPSCNTVFIGRLPPIKNWEEGASSAPLTAPQIIDWQRAHPLLNQVELGSASIIDSYVLRAPAGGQSLVDSTLGSIMAIAPRGPYQDVVIGFDIIGSDNAGRTTVNTNWPRTPGFPTFWLNAIRTLGGGASATALEVHRPGTPVKVELAERVKSPVLIKPDGQRLSFVSPEGLDLVITDTDALGFYEVRNGTRLAARFAVNLFDRQESDVRLRTSINTTNGQPQVKPLTIGFADIAASSKTQVRAELWTALLLAALVGLALEWYIYNRRVYL
jgi:hypothetical protein